MNLATLRSLTVAATVSAAAAACSHPPDSDSPPRTRPNIILLLVDDMGYADTEPYGNAYHRTPHISRLASEGVRFTNAYAAAPNCSPTRASILTGRWPARTGVTQYLPGNLLPHARLTQADLPLGLPLSESLVAEPLAGAGYATACIGKWHLGGGKYAPSRRGFSDSFAAGQWGSHETMFAPHTRISVPGAQDGDYLTEGLTEAALRFVRSSEGRPFFLYLPYYAVHSPIESRRSWIDSYDGRRDPTGRNHAAYAAMVEGVDRSVGRILEELDRSGLDSETAIFFLSDNGGVPSRAFNGDLRSGKGYLWEGGIRIPFIARWPGSFPQGAVERTPVSSVDLYPTILRLAGAADMPAHSFDGADLSPLLTRSGSLGRDALYWHYPHYSNSGSKPAGAIRKGRWKLVEFFEDSSAELYDLEADPGEANDLAAEDPRRAADMRAELSAWRESVGAVMPRENPSWDPDRERERYFVQYKDEWDPDEPLVPRP